MKILEVTPNNRKRAFEVGTPEGTYSFPYAKLDIEPSSMPFSSTTGTRAS